MDSGLLAQIQGAKNVKLKKAVTVDKSGPVGAGAVLDGSAPAKPKGAPPVPRAAAAGGGADDDEPERPQQLAGLFAGGMPTLKKSAGTIATVPSPPTELALPSAPTRSFPPSSQFPPPRPFDAGANIGRKKLGNWDFKAHLA
ncbi:hypothetical protein MNV49_007600 [Pseudohyphozyma bogoriensis]|nr:hypothetical protein MNV49_007600 [Pseudohyphozyma bogoriensis]